MSEQTENRVRPLNGEEIEANGTIYGALLQQRMALEQNTLHIFTVLAAFNGVLATYATNKNIAIAAGLISVAVCWLFALIPNRKRWLRTERDGFATQQLLREGETRIGASSFDAPRRMRILSLGPDLGVLATALFWVAQIPPIAHRLETGLGYLWTAL